MELPTSPMRGSGRNQLREFWFQRFSRPTIFLIIAIALVGVYAAFTIPVSVFPITDFPRLVIGVDNGVAPIDQMFPGCGVSARLPAGDLRMSTFPSIGSPTWC